MRAIAIGNSGQDLSLEKANATGTVQTIFHLTLQKKYEIFGMILWKGVLRYLIVDDSDLPDWNPADLFDLDSQKIPESWYFRPLPQLDAAIWGYKRLVDDIQHYEGLTEGNDEDRVYFFKYKMELERLQKEKLDEADLLKMAEKNYTLVEKLDRRSCND